jgi:hypothetical protein
MTTEEMVDAFIKHVDQYRRYERQVTQLIYELEKWQAVAISGISEEAIAAALFAYDMENKK